MVSLDDTITGNNIIACVSTTNNVAMYKLLYVDVNKTWNMFLNVTVSAK